MRSLFSRVNKLRKSKREVSGLSAWDLRCEVMTVAGSDHFRANPGGKRSEAQLWEGGG